MSKIEDVIRPESAVAEDLKKRFFELMTPVMQLLDEAESLGLPINWDNIVKPDGMPRGIVNFRITRTYR